MIEKTSSNYQIDNIDKQILSLLMQNARMPFLEIARICGISGAAIHQRVKKLEDAGVIEGSRFIVNPKALGYGVCAYIGLLLTSSNKYLDVVKAFEDIPEIVESNFVTGDYSLIIKVFCRDNEHLMHVLVDHMQHIEGIASTRTFISLAQPISREFDIPEVKK
ncbi:MAG: Lrp/AsnC ligand binding domain-containing protein [Bacteroidales bacterium]|nr:Lrp/AsnC ligand binding domain-containing protein [Bacteroidales bacterium]